MPEIHRGPARSCPLALLVFLFMLLPLATSHTAGADAADTPGPLAQEMTYKMFVDSEIAQKGYTLVAPYMGYKVTLVDYDGVVVHTWRSDRQDISSPAA